MEQVFALLTAAAVAFGPLAMGVTKLVDGLRGIADPADKAPRWLWIAAAWIVSIVVAVAFGLNVVGSLAAEVPKLADIDLSGTAGEVLTGAGMASFASYWHGRMAKASAEAKH